MYPYDYNPFDYIYGQPPPFSGGPGRPIGPGYPGGPAQQSQSDRPPQGPPPSFTPRQAAGVMAIDPGSIRMCRYKYTYIWPTGRGRGFWTYLTYIGRRSVSGYRWNGFRWIRYGTDLNNISSFACY